MTAPLPENRSASRRSRGAWAWVSAVGIVSAALTWVVLQPRRTEATVPSERTAAELDRQADRLCEKESGRPFTGWLVDRYPDAVLKSRSWLSNGVLHGPSEGWYASGTLQVREQFADGVTEGTVTRWREDGSKLSEGITHVGKQEGLFRRWHPDGQLSEEIPFQDGVPDGLSRAWHPDGSFKAEVRHQKGSIVERRFWKPGEKDGRVVAEQGGRVP